MRITGQLPVADAALLTAQLDALIPAASTYGLTGEAPSPDARRADALVHQGSTTHSRAQRPQRGIGWAGENPRLTDEGGGRQGGTAERCPTRRSPSWHPAQAAPTPTPPCRPVPGTRQRHTRPRDPREGPSHDPSRPATPLRGRPSSGAGGTGHAAPRATLLRERTGGPRRSAGGPPQLRERWGRTRLGDRVDPVTAPSCTECRYRRSEITLPLPSTRVVANSRDRYTSTSAARNAGRYRPASPPPAATLRIPGPKSEAM